MRNTKYRRTKNLVKKSIEIGSQCELDIVLIIFDRRFNRYKEVHTSPDLTLNNVVSALKLNGEDSPRKYKRHFARDLVDIPDEDDSDDL